jgi:GMP synthase-like glutamine amidotransferase
MAIKIGILQCGKFTHALGEKYDSYTNLFSILFEGNPLEFVTYNVFLNEFPKDFKEVDGYVVTGSPRGVYEDHDWIAPLEQIVRDCFDISLPVVGICFGHQLMAQALGGRVEKYNDGWSTGRVVYQTPDGNEMKLNAFHQDQVIEPPLGAKTILSSEFCKYAGLSYGAKGISLQPHPEMDGDFIATLLDVRGKELLNDAQLKQTYESLNDDLDVGGATRMLLDILVPQLMPKKGEDIARESATSLKSI